MNITSLIEPYLSNPAVLVFVDEQIKKSFIRNLQEKHSFRKIKYITLAELKQLLFLYDKPAVNGEKRIVALDSILDVEIKKFFGIRDYLDTSVFAGKFFEFFQTIQEANCLELTESFFESTADSENQLNWQISTFNMLILVRDKYLSLIGENGYVDEAFIGMEVLSLSCFDGYEQLIFVGNDGYSKREQTILEYLRKQKTVVEVAASEGLSFQNNNLQKVTINRCSDSFGQLVHLASIADRDSFDVIVDLANDSIRYAELLDLDTFELKYSSYFNSSRVYSALKCLEMLVNSISDGKIDGYRLEEACSNSEFCNYYQVSEEDVSLLRKKLANNRIFFSLSSFSLKKLEEDISKIQKLKNVNDLVEFIKGMDLARLLESSFDTILDKLFGQLFSLQKAFNSEVCVKNSLRGVGWLNLLLKRCEHLKLEYLLPKATEKKLRVVDFKKSWFLENKRVLLLNANENVLSGIKHKVYLFTEKQLRVLGATTREDLLEQQRKLFLQLCLRNKQITIYCVDNATEGKQTSSYVEELVLELPAEKVSQVSVKSDSYYGGYIQKMVSKNAYIKNLSGEELIRVKESDFGEEVVLSATSFETLRACPLKFYLEKVAKVSRLKIEESSDIKDNVLGNIVHDIFAQICAEMKQFIGKDVTFSKVLEGINAHRVISAIFGKNSDMLPEAYTQDYAEQVIVPILAESIKKFFVNVCGKKFELKDISQLYVEDDVVDSNLAVGEFAIDGKKVQLKITGRADLRIELLDGRVFIFDFKTGTTMKEEQLSFYSEYYYEGRAESEETKPQLFFYQVFDMQEQQAKHIDIKAMINTFWAQLVDKKEYDFAVTTKACKYCEHEGICRKNG